jgi:hypothetical protein
MRSASLRPLLGQPTHRGLPPWAQSLRSRTSWPRPEQLRQVDPQGLTDGVQAREGGAWRVTAFEGGEGSDADPCGVREALLGRPGYPPAIPQVVAESSEQLRVAHAYSRQPLAILFQAVRCLYCRRGRSREMACK